MRDPLNPSHKPKTVVLYSVTAMHDLGIIPTTPCAAIRRLVDLVKVRRKRSSSSYSTDQKSHWSLFEKVENINCLAKGSHSEVDARR